MITRVTIPLLPDEYEMLTWLAEADLRPLADELRYLVRCEARRRFGPTPQPEAERPEGVHHG